jgi:hypothetical protein
MVFSLILSTGNASLFGGVLLGVSEKPDGIPEHEREIEQQARSRAVTMQKETEKLSVVAQISKVMNPLHVPSHPPFIRRRRDFDIPKTPSRSKNIPNVNTYMNVFFISYIYKPATSSYPKPGLFGMTTLTLHLTGS